MPPLQPTHKSTPLSGGTTHTPLQVRRGVAPEESMSHTTKVRLAILLLGILVSCALLAGTVLSMEMPRVSDPYPGPGPGKYTMLYFGPFVALNPVYFLIFALGSLGIPDTVGIGLMIAIELAWWWYIAGVAARFISKRRIC